MINSLDEGVNLERKNSIQNGVSPLYIGIDIFNLIRSVYYLYL